MYDLGIVVVSKPLFTPLHVFCRDRPVAPNERIYIRFAEISTSWSGVMRFGFTSVDPVNINPADLPR